MALNRLLIRDLRNLSSVDLHLAPAINLFYGENGSGKTSLLEAIHVLSVGRSFRSHKIKSLINEARPSLTVFGRILAQGAEVPIGVQRYREGQVQSKAGGRALQSVAELASYLPLQVIDAEAFSLLDGSPSVRRQFLDWLVFHVEPSFYPAWRNAQRCLKHRNTLLRRGRIEPAELQPWDQELIQASVTIDSLRKQCFQVFTGALEKLLEQFGIAEGLSIKLFNGWGKEDYSQTLKASFERDCHAGFTHASINRADVRVRLNGVNAAEILSRGQQKLLVCAFKIAQGVAFEQLTQRRCVYLVDDLPAELDKTHSALLVSWLRRLDTQVFITGIEREVLLEAWRDKPLASIKVFHVERGKIIQDDEVSVPDSLPVRPTE